MANCLLVAGQVEADGPWPPHHSSLPQPIRYMHKELLEHDMAKHMDLGKDPREGLTTLHSL